MALYLIYTGKLTIKKMPQKQFFFIITIAFFLSCEDKPLLANELDLTGTAYLPRDYNFNYPSSFGKPILPADNPTTIDGVKLGKKLFFDPILSRDSSMSCGSCHNQSIAFTDSKRFSIGVDGKPGTRSSMSLVNLMFTNRGFFWDGRVKTLEEQALVPIEDPVELHTTWPDVEIKLRRNEEYKVLFRKAFGIKIKDEITKELVVKAIAQFERTLISSNSKFDRIQAGLAKYTDLELYGLSMFLDEDPDVKDAECGHCHNLPLLTSDQFFNNGLDEAPNLTEFKDLGLGGFTKKLIDNGKFKAPSLRNILLSAPYMHDSRFQNIDEVIDHYSNGGKRAPNKDPLIYPLKFSLYERAALKAFLGTLTDSTFIVDPAFKP